MIASGGARGDGRKLVSVVSFCFNEEQNVRELADRVRAVLAGNEGYRYEHIFIDNASTDRTVAVLKEIAAGDKHVKIIVNTKNFGVYRSPMHAFLQAKGDAVIPMAADLQDPPELISEFLVRWEEGYKIVAGIKRQTQENPFMALLRRTYYSLIAALSETEEIKNFTGFGLYDKVVMDLIHSTGDHYPYVRGLISEMGFPIARVEYDRPGRQRGVTKNSLYDLYTQAMNGIVNQSKLPLRFATLTGFILAFLCALVAVGYFIYKLLYWDSFDLGAAPLVIGMFFLSAVQLIFLGITGEYIGAIHGRLFQKWLVIEKERINFDD